MSADFRRGRPRLPEPPAPESGLSDDDQIDARFLDDRDHLFGNPLVGDDHVDVLQRADAAETALSEFRRVGQHDDLRGGVRASSAA